MGGAPGDTFWSSAPDYNSNGLPNPANGEHNAGANCMNCHSSGGDRWAFGGTVYNASGDAAPNVQVAVSDGTVFLVTYSGTNGNFWVPASGTAIDWANAETRIRNSNGEAAMISAPTAACNSCHSGGMALTEP